MLVPNKLKAFIDKIWEDNLFLLSSSVSYYSALAIAPFLLILLWVASYIGSDVQRRIVSMALDFSPEVGKLIQVIFANVNEGLSFSSISGIIGTVVLLWSASLVFLQLRYSFDVIYGHRVSGGPISILGVVKERLFAMFIVIAAGLFLAISSSLPRIVNLFLSGTGKVSYYQWIAQGLNAFVYIFMFWGIHYLVPSKRPSSWGALKSATLSSVFFFIGNYFLTEYLKTIASSSIYGAAGSLLIFLIWAYYSAFTLFLSVEFFVFLKQISKSKRA